MEWEERGGRGEEAGIRTVFARTGWSSPATAAPGDGSSRIFQAGARRTARLGNQYWSFIALHDHIAALRHLIDTEDPGAR